MTKSTTTPKQNEELGSHNNLVRAVEAALKIAVPEEPELRFRRSLLNRAAADLGGLKPTFVIRMFEAACDVRFPSPEVTDFRLVLENQLGREFQLSKYRNPTTTTA